MSRQRSRAASQKSSLSNSRSAVEAQPAKLQIQCPRCQARLRIYASLAGQQARCPKCWAKLVLAASEPIPEASVEEFPAWLRAFLGLAVLIMLGMVLSIWIGPGVGMLLTVVMGIGVLALWQREWTGRLLAQVAQKFSQTRQANRSLQEFSEPDEEPVHRSRRQRQLDVSGAIYDENSTSHLDGEDSSPPSRNSSRIKELQETPLEIVFEEYRPNTPGKAVAHSDLAEIQPASPGTKPAIPRPGTESPGRVPRQPSAPRTQVPFYGPGTECRVQGRLLRSPLAYIVERQLDELFDDSLIEIGRPVSPSRRPAEPLPYWPNYRSCSPEQRFVYLDWLEAGRARPDIEIGYVFIHFYGLERRIFVDQQDHLPVASELVRLLRLYSSSNSFRRYATNLLWATLLTAPAATRWPEDVLQTALNQVPGGKSEVLPAMLAWFQQRDGVLDAPGAFIVAEHDPRSQRSVVVKRHEEQFRELFQLRFREAYPQGLVLKTSKRDFRWDIRPASASLPCFSDTSLTLPNVMGITSQFKKLVEIWATTIQDLKIYDRVQQKSAGAGLTAAAYEALPEELRSSDHPLFENWYEIIQKHTDAAGWIAVPVGELAATQGIARRNRLTKKQSQDLLTTADCMSLCIEPDARESGQNYRWDEPVAVFPREHGEEELKSYHAASILLRLGMTIAAADDHIDASELQTIRQCLEDRFDLSSQAAVRLEHLAHVLSKAPVDGSSLAKKLTALPLPQRTQVGEFLIGIAAADGVITTEELRALKKTFKQLKLEEQRIEELSVGEIELETETGPSTGAVVLNHDKVRAILSETREVADYLQSVMIGDEEEPPARTNLTPPVPPARQAAQHAVSAAPTWMQSLDVRYHLFLGRVVERANWEQQEFDQLARECKVMAAGAVAAINEWSLEVLGDWLLDDTGDTVEVALSLLPGST